MKMHTGIVPVSYLYKFGIFIYYWFWNALMVLRLLTDKEKITGNMRKFVGDRGIPFPKTPYSSFGHNQLSNSHEKSVNQGI